MTVVYVVVRRHGGTCSGWHLALARAFPTSELAWAALHELVRGSPNAYTYRVETLEVAP